MLAAQLEVVFLEKEKKAHVEFQQSYFDQHVDFFKNPIPDEVVERSREIVRAIVTDTGMRILDVGCGVGAFLRLYHEAGVPFEQIVGCDLSKEMLREARNRYPLIDFWQGDVLYFPEEKGTFDLIVFNACFGNIFDQLSVMRKCHQLLSANGRIAISHPMGNKFVQELQKMEPKLVFSLLPERELLDNWCAQLNMKLALFRDEAQLYIAMLQCAA